MSAVMEEDKQGGYLLKKKKIEASRHLGPQFDVLDKEKSREKKIGAVLGASKKGSGSRKGPK